MATLIARIQTIGMEHYFAIALDSGVTPAELSDIVTAIALHPRPAGTRFRPRAASLRTFSQGCPGEAHAS